jgi:hypothetical protein
VSSATLSGYNPTLGTRTVGRLGVESRCGGVDVGRTYLLPPPFVWRCLTGSTLSMCIFQVKRTSAAKQQLLTLDHRKCEDEILSNGA